MAYDKNDPETIAAFEAATAALVAKRDELLAEVRVAKAKAKGSDIDPVEHARLQGEVDSLAEKLAGASRLSKAETDRLTKSLAEKDAVLSTHLIDAGISSAMAAGGVAKQFVKPLLALFKSQAAVKADANGAYAAVIGDKPLSDSITGYLLSDEGKHFLTAPANGGGGAGGGAGGAGLKKFSEMTTEAKTELYRKDPKAYSAARAAG